MYSNSIFIERCILMAYLLKGAELGKRMKNGNDINNEIL